MRWLTLRLQKITPIAPTATMIRAAIATGMIGKLGGGVSARGVAFASLEKLLGPTLFIAVIL